MAVYNLSKKHDGYARLAAAIINNGVQAHDKSFLESDWCDLLRALVDYEGQLNVDGSINLDPRGDFSNGFEKA